uniref:t-SNARE coiled-coil homology domain-containing protein n=2 Tax=Globodera pallida TaxID=36090 RepID=A0A183CKY1_GLOPA
MFSNSPSTALPHPSSIHPSGISNRTIIRSSFDNFFEEEVQSEENIYERHLAQQQMSREEARLVELQLYKEQAKDKADATQQVAQDINDLNQIMQDLAQLVHEQHDMVDSIEDHVERSMREVKVGERNLRRAVASNSAKYPVAAAAVGGAVLGGPIGVAAGSLVAGVAAAVGGAFAGLYGGRILQRKVQKNVTTAAISVGNEALANNGH